MHFYISPISLSKIIFYFNQPARSASCTVGWLFAFGVREPNS